MPLLITDTLRTVAEQEALYAKGRTAAGSIVTNCRGISFESLHQWGLAFDFCRNVPGREYDDKDGFFAEVGKVAVHIGLTWGGHFKSFPDKPHVEYPGFTTAALRSKYGTPDKFMQSWNDVIEIMAAGGIAFDTVYWRAALSGVISPKAEYVHELVRRINEKKLISRIGADDLTKLLLLLLGKEVQA